MANAVEITRHLESSKVQLQYRGFLAEWDGEQIYIHPIVRGGVGWSEYASTWVDAMWSLRRAVRSA